MPDREPLKLEPRDPVLYFIQRLRDEAHRFVIGSHRKLPQKDIREAGLQEIPGNRPVTQTCLLHHFGTLKEIERASIADLGKVPGVSAESARKIFEFFQRPAGLGAGFGSYLRRLNRSPARARLTFSFGGIGKADEHRDDRGSAKSSLSLPNILTYARIAAIPVVVGCIYARPSWMGRYGCGGWRWRCSSRRKLPIFLDGYYARIWDQHSAFGGCSIRSPTSFWSRPAC